ncbi:hypothetical protein BGZ83_004252 [Gryganskiella cystojenkinii]|nr:hypothetical protein BGZ83_004252 [Gryganskiella cystojenkinii]
MKLYKRILTRGPTPPSMPTVFFDVVGEYTGSLTVSISQNLADLRSEVMLALEKLVDPDVLAVRNFIYTPKIL